MEEPDCLISGGNLYVYKSVVDSGALHLAFPAIAGSADGSKLLIAYREGETHISFDGRIIQKESYDKGKTWVNRKVIYEGKAGDDARDPQFVTLPDGTIICRFFVRTSKESSCVKYIRTNDCGKNYTNAVGEFPMPYKSETFSAARGNMLVKDDVIYSTAYNRWNDNWLMKSTDKGISWEFVSWIHKPVERSMHKLLNEASVGSYGDKLYVVSRSGIDEVRNMILVESDDRGSTWNEPKTLPVYGHAPSLTPYKDMHILTWRNTKTDDNEFNRCQFDMALMKEGNLYSKTVTLLETRSFDMGYGDVFTFDDFFLVCCYAEENIYCFSILYDVFAES
jgi:hypothetical protein